MTSDLESISKLLSPPTDSVGLDRPWRTVERELGTPLPSDYKEFIDRYGSGMICGSMSVWNFRDAAIFSKPLAKVLTGPGGVVQAYERIRAMGNSWPFTMYPQPGGLLPFVTVRDVHHLNWLADGPPDTWDVVYWFFDGLEFIHLKGDSFTGFLLKVLKKKYNRKELPQFDPPFEFTPLSR
jgi:hypothetical protein